jgi:hypothetical protein
LLTQSVLVSFSGSRKRENILTEVDRVNTKSLETLVASLLTIIVRAIGLEILAALNKSKLSCKEDLIAFSCSFEPFTHELLAIVVLTLTVLLAKYVLSTIMNGDLLGAVPEGGP